MRRMDTLGILGLAMLVAGAVTFLSGSASVPMWVAWLVGPLLWYMGFAVVIAWLAYRLLAPAQSAAEEPAERPVRAIAREPQRSNFHEHDCDVSAEGSPFRVPVFSGALVLLMCSLTAVAMFLMQR
jgi:hypothetical protein